MQQLLFLSEKYNIVLLPGQTKEGIINAFKSRIDLKFPKAESQSREVPDVNVHIGYHVTDGELITTIEIRLAENLVAA